MTPTELLASFETFADAPDGIERLRELVLDLSVRGKVVPQDSNDESASILINRLEATWGKGTKPFPGNRDCRDYAGPIDKPYEVPLGWEWRRLGFIAHDHGQQVPAADFTYLDVGSIDNKLGVIASPSVLPAKGAPSRARKIIRRGTVIYSTVRPYLRNIAVVEGEFSPPPIASTAFAVLQPLPFLLDRYLYIFLRSPFFQDYVASKMRGVAYPAINDATLMQSPIALPPLEEQRRIVAKVDELMAHIDKLEAARNEREATRIALRDSALTSFDAARTTEAVKSTWERISTNLPELLSCPEDVDSLRRLVLGLAVRGRLVADSSSATAHELLEELRSADKTLRKDNPPKNREPYQLPAHWTWCWFTDAAKIESNLVDPAKFKNLPHIAPDNIQKGIGRLLPYRTIAEDAVTSGKHRFYPGQILYSKIRPALNKAVVVNFEGLCSADMYPLRARINPRYVLHAMLSDVFVAQTTAFANRVAMPKVNQEQLASVLFPLPPLPEQASIVKALDAMFDLCDKLEQQLAASQAAHAAFAAAAAHHLTV